MDADGNDFSCQTCHVTEKHDIPGNSIGVSPGGITEVDCASCHDQAPHSESRLNQHTAAIACQTCHIPFFAKVLPTKTWWDWSTAGDRERKNIKDRYGKDTYVAKKGDMIYDTMIVPEYAWYEDGKNQAYIRGEKIDPEQVLIMAGPIATRADAKAKISPFKVMGGKQIYDKNNKILIAAHLVGDDGFWHTFDWNQAATIGMKAAGLPYSGEYDFVETRMYWRINHMVSAKDEALSCLDCHGDKGRMDWKALGYEGNPMNDSKYSRSK
jgi:octaheme c-type cytochrome (tetrathionate reductase family)